MRRGSSAHSRYELDAQRQEGTGGEGEGRERQAHDRGSITGWRARRSERVAWVVAGRAAATIQTADPN